MAEFQVFLVVRAHAANDEAQVERGHATGIHAGRSREAGRQQESDDGVDCPRSWSHGPGSEELW